MHAPSFQDLAVLFSLAAVTTVIFNRLSLPITLGYLCVGAVAGPHALAWIADTDVVEMWAEVGVSFLMFSIGLEFSFHKLIRVGRPAAIIATLETGAALIAGFLVGRAFGWTAFESMCLGGVCCIASTSILYRSLHALGFESKQFALEAYGILIVEDLIAIVLLVALSGVGRSGSVQFTDIGEATLKLLFVLTSWLLTGYFAVPVLVKKIERHLNDEILLVVSVALCMGLSVISIRTGYSAALGAFVMGSILAESSERERISALFAPIRDLFSSLFFISIGMLFNVQAIADVLPLLVLVVGIVIFLKPAATTIIAILSGRSTVRAAQIGMSLGQIGEFSFLIAALARNDGSATNSLFPIAVGTSVLTTALSPFWIRSSTPVGFWIERKVPRNILSVLDRWRRSKSGPLVSGTWRVGIARFLLNAVMTVVAFVVVDQFVVPWLAKINEILETALCQWILSVLFAAPFIWGMTHAFIKESREEKISAEVPLRRLFGQLCAAGLIAVLSEALFPSKSLLILFSIGFVALFGLFYRRLERSYAWIEKQLLTNLESHVPLDQALESSLSKWDLNLIKVKLHADCELVEKSLLENRIRELHHVTVIGILRGSRTFLTPPAATLLLPADELLVMGTEDDTIQFKKWVEGSFVRATPSPDQTLLFDILIDEKSPWCNETIRNAKIRESERALVVAIERASTRLANPDPSFQLLSGDRIWLMRIE